MKQHARRKQYQDTPRLPSAGTHHAPQIQMVAAYATIDPGNALEGSVLPIIFDRYKDDPGDPDYITLLAAPSAFVIRDPFHMVCAGVGEQFFVIRDNYRGVWMPLAPHGLVRHAELDADLVPGGNVPNSTVSLFDYTGAANGALTATIYSGQNSGDTTTGGSVIPVAYISAERKWYSLVESP